jgi:predicted dithiol-disulfide oxidoreductase (DUF899 family)
MRAKAASSGKRLRPGTLHAVRFPGEDKAYRAARNGLLRAEVDLRRRIETVAALRRKLPLGGPAPQDYVFEEISGAELRRVKLSELFAPGKNTLAVYSFMYGPNMAHACPLCTSMLDSLDGAAPHVAQRINLAVVAKSPIARVQEFAKGRGWRNLRLISSAGNTFNADYHGETPEGAQLPMLNVFALHRGRIRHTYATELLFMPTEGGQDPRHVDSIWPLWNVLDFTREGRGTNWHPRLIYDLC